MGLSTVAGAAALTTGEIVAVSAASNVVGGAVSRTLDSDTSETALGEVASVGVDALFGAAGGAVGAKAGSAAIKETVTGAEKQIAASLTKASRGNVGAKASVRGHQAQLQNAQNQGQALEATVGAVLTNQALPVAKEILTPDDDK